MVESASPTSTTTTATVPPADTCGGFRGTTTALKSVGPTVPGSLIQAEAAAIGCLDAVVFTFRSLGDGTPPGYTVEYVDPSQHPFLDGDPPTPIDLPGAAFLLVKIRPALSIDPFAEGAPSTYGGNLSLEYGDHHHLQIVRELPDGRNTVRWVIGLDGVRPFRVDRAADPTRVTVLIG